MVNREKTGLVPISGKAGKHLRFGVILAVILFIAFSGKGFAQAVTTNGLRYPWAGGLNSCTFGAVDLDIDGTRDLVVFERLGNRVMPFIRNNTTATVDYSWHPEYSALLPDLHEWVQFVDYNCDGKEDIFTYYSGGIRVYRNVSDTSLKFRLVTDMVLSYYYTGFVGILGTPVDYPVFADLDGDGDTDILTFFGLGSFVEFHRNFSVEHFGNCDSLDYRLIDNCWGDFKESEGGNKITLDAICPGKEMPLPGNPVRSDSPKHTGSTMLATDLNGDGVKDLLLGDVDFPDIIEMINGGTGDSAHMISVDSIYPGSHPVRLYSFPSCSNIDMDNDGLKDLVVSPFDPAYFVSENFRSVWLYKNTGTQSAPVFDFRNDRFFQDEMIDVGTNSFPVLFDIDGDGLPDLFAGDYGYYDSSYYKEGILHSVYTSRIAWFRNTGTPSGPAFTLVTDDYAGLSSLQRTGLYPAFGDPDGDGDIDLLLGNTDGSLIFLENTAGPGHPPVYAQPVFNYQGINAGHSSAPQFFDLDKDGLSDLVIGRQDGTISYYRNSGPTGNPQFVLVTDKLGNVDVTNPNVSYYGFSVPCFFRDKGNVTGLVVGCEEGKIYYFTGIDNNLSGSFTPSDSLFMLITGTPFTINPGWHTAAAIAYLSDATYMDLVTGNFAGGLNYLSRQPLPPVMTSIPQPPAGNRNTLSVYPNPADNILHIKINPDQSFRSSLLEIYSTSGIRVFSRALSGNETGVPVYGFPEGLYMVILTSQDQQSLGKRAIAKIIVKH